MVESSFKIALTFCLLSLFCLFFMGDFNFEQLFGVRLIMLIFFLSAISFMFGLISIGCISGFWSSIGRGIVLILSFGAGVFSGFLWLFDYIIKEIS